MKKLKWLLEVADKKPLLFSILLLLIAVGYLAQIIKNDKEKIDRCDDEKTVIQAYYVRKMDSVIQASTQREANLNSEVKRVLNVIIEQYQKQLEEQKKLNHTIKETIDKNDKILNKKKVKP